MRFAHLADTHLGHRQYGIFEREQDFYDLFEKTVDKIIDENVDFVIHSGDLFDSARPSTNALLSFQRGLLKLKEADIPVYAIAGNHDSVLRKNVKPPIDLFEEQGLNIIRFNRAFLEEDVFICGVPYAPKSKRDGLIKILNILADEAQKYPKSVLVLHQGIDKTLPEDAYELDLDELPKSFDYYALGHIHDYFEEDYGNGKLVYPGSMEMYKQNGNFESYGKGFCVVDMSENEVKVKRVKVDIERLHLRQTINYQKLREELERMSALLDEFEKPPMLDLTVQGGDFDGSDVYEIIQEAIGDKVLNLRPVFKPEKILNDEKLIDEGKRLDPKSLLKEKISEKYQSPEITNLSLDLLDYLSSKRLDDAKDISHSFYNNYCTVDEEEDGQ